MPGASAYIGLAAPGEAGSWQQEGKVGDRACTVKASQSHSDN